MIGLIIFMQEFLSLMSGIQVMGCKWKVITRFLTGLEINRIVFGNSRVHWTIIHAAGT